VWATDTGAESNHSKFKTLIALLQD
jgi:hypothetical protein